MKKQIVAGILALAAVAFISGVTLLVLAAPGSKDDPFITLSYLTGKFKPQIMSEVKDTEKSLAEKFDASVEELQSQFQSQGGDASSPDSADRFSVVTLTKGQTLKCSVGAEIMLRVGTATGAGSAPALVDYTDGATLTAGSDLIINHMYLITIEGNGVTATAATVRVLVRGEYKIT